MHLERGDRVALLVPGSTTYLDAVISLLVRGIVPIPLDPRLTEQERTRILADLDPTLVVTGPDALAAVISSDTEKWGPIVKELGLAGG